MKRFVYVLWHLYYYGRSNEHEEVKMLGVYSTKLQAIGAIKKFLLLPGFKDYSVSCFEIYKCKIDKLDYKKISSITWRKCDRKKLCFQ